MAGTAGRISKFEVNREEQNLLGFENKTIDERAFYEMYPKAMTYKMLDSTRRHIATNYRSNIISPQGNLMDLFRDQARIMDSEGALTVRWKLFTNDGDVRSSFVKWYVDDITCIAKGGTEFEIGLDTDFFGANDVIIFEGLRECPILIRSEPFPDGRAWKYTAAILGDLEDAFPAEYLNSGDRLIQIGSLIGEATQERGNAHWSNGEAFVEFEVPLTRMGWNYKVTDNAWLAAKSYRLKPCDKDGQRAGKDIMFSSLDAKFEDAIERQKDLWLVYGRSAGKFAGNFLDGITRKDLRTGPGLYEFLESACVIDWNPESNIISLLSAILPPLWDDKVAKEDQAVDVYTGKGGLIAWQDAGRELDVFGVMQTAELNYTSTEGFAKGQRGVGLNAKRYTEYHIEPFGTIRVKHLPFLDSKLINTKTYKGLPLSSYEFWIFNYGYGDGKDGNIYIFNDKRIEQRLYGIGTWTPLGPVGSVKNRGSRSAFVNTLGHENAYEYIYECMMGFVMKDTSAFILVRPNIR